MNRKLITICLVTAFTGLITVGHTNAGAKTAENCLEDVERLEHEMHRDRNEYTPESIRAAEHDLEKAKKNRKDHAECRKHYLDAEEELRRGKRKRH